MQQLTLTERCLDWNHDLTVDASTRIVKNVALAGQSSRNGYQYSDEALQAAVPLYDGKPVFLDHAANRQRPQERSTRDLVGSICSPRFVNGRVRGDIRILDTPSGQMFLKLVEDALPGVGMSHVVLAQRSTDGTSVERILDVISVDVVVNPATTTTFRESCSATAAPSSGPSIPTDVPGESSLQAENLQLRMQLEALRSQLDAARHQETVQRFIADSGLPPHAISECFREQLLAAPTDVARRRLIQDRLLLLSNIPASSPPARSDERRNASPSRCSDEQFIRLVRRR